MDHFARGSIPELAIRFMACYTLVNGGSRIVINAAQRPRRTAFLRISQVPRRYGDGFNPVDMRSDPGVKGEVRERKLDRGKKDNRNQFGGVMGSWDRGWPPGQSSLNTVILGIQNVSHCAQV